MTRPTTPNEAYWIQKDGSSVYAVAHAGATVRGSSTVDADLTHLETIIASAGRFTVTDVVINPEAWHEPDAEEAGAAVELCAVVPITGASPDTIPIAIINRDDVAGAIQSGFDSGCRADAGTVTFYAKNIPNIPIRLSIFTMFAQNMEKEVEVAGPDAPVVAYYKLPVATSETLGGVKIGKNIDITADGTISAKGSAGCNHILSGGIDDGSHHTCTEESIRDLVAGSDEVNDALNRALGIDTDPEESPPVDDESGVSQD